MKLCFYNTWHMGDTYFASFFVNLICRQNPDKQFLYYSINGDVFFQNTPNIRRIEPLEREYREGYQNGQAPENGLNCDILTLLKEHNMDGDGGKIISYNNREIFFLNVWCQSQFLKHEDFNLDHAIFAYQQMIPFINNKYGFGLQFHLNSTRELLENVRQSTFDISHIQTDNLSLNDAIFVFNYVPRSLSGNNGYYAVDQLHQTIRNLSKTYTIIVASHHPYLDNLPNIYFADKDFHIYPRPSCENLLDLWEIAIQCKQIVILVTGGSWTFLHKIDEIKPGQILAVDNIHPFKDKLNNTLNRFYGENKNPIHRFEDWITALR
jgi:hypothetical protein